jgi:hypothetical protein
MTRRYFWPTLAAVALIAPSLLMGLEKAAFFKIEDLRPGMKGIGKTCYQGTKPEEFQVEILGVLHGVGPGSDAVLAKLSGGLLDKTGVFEGMSGSPVFIDGKLLGAVAFSYSFAKEAIGGITPITQMVNAFEESGEASQGPNVILKKSTLWNYRLPENQGKALALISSELRQHPVTSFGGHALVPIATPLSLGGLDPQTVKLFAPEFRSMGMSMLQGVGGSGVAANAKEEGEETDSQLEPGSNIAVSLVRGDLDVSAGGTVTYVDGKKLYAFGHNMFDLGFTELPMHKAKAITVFPSLENSFKILETGEMAGSIRQDRGSGIYGVIGEKPRMVPMQVHLTTSRGNKRELKYELARDPLLTPLLVNLTLYNSIIASERAQGAVTLKIKGKINIKNEEPVELDNRFSSDDSAPALASLSIAVPINYLFSAGYKNLDLEGMDIQISAQESDQSALLDSIRFGRTEVKAGESLDLEVSYKKSDGEVFEDKYPVKIPANASPGTLTMLLADGTTLMALDDQEEGETLIPRDLSQLIKFINNLRKNDHLYLRFFRQEPGALVRGEGLPGLPPSILSILKSERSVGGISAIHTSTLMEYELPATDYMITGAKVLRLTVKP